MESLFKIFRVGPEEADQIAASPSEPHHHTYEELILGIEGALEHFIDFETKSIVAPFVCFVTRGKVHRVIPRTLNGRCDWRVLRFRSEFVPEITFQLYAAYHNHAMFELKRGAWVDRMQTICQLIEGEMDQVPPDLAIVRPLLSALLTMVDAQRPPNKPHLEAKSRMPNSTLEKFLQLLEQNYHHPLGVEFYADKLTMTARNLNLITKSILQQTVSEIIETRKLIEAKNLLTRTDRQISEIAYALGYNEKSYFAQVFKKRTGQTPTEFREEMRRQFS